MILLIWSLVILLSCSLIWLLLTVALLPYMVIVYCCPVELLPYMVIAYCCPVELLPYMVIVYCCPVELLPYMVIVYYCPVELLPFMVVCLQREKARTRYKTVNMGRRTRPLSLRSTHWSQQCCQGRRGGRSQLQPASHLLLSPGR